MPLRSSILKMLIFSAICVTSQILPSVAEEPFPSRLIRLIVPFPSGGLLDISARIVSAKAAEMLGQPIVVENKPGGYGQIAVSAVNSEPADGYTLMLVHGGYITDPIFIANDQVKIRYDYLNDFVPVASLVQVNSVLAVNKDIPARNLTELVALIKAHPGKYNFGSNGRGQIPHLVGLQLKYAADLNMLHVPYRGATSLYTDLASGVVQITVASRASLLPYIDSGMVRLIGVVSDHRDPSMPEVPTFAESGYPNIVGGVWLGIVAPKGVPSPILDKLNREFSAALQADDLKKKWASLGATVWATSREGFAIFQKSQHNFWRKFADDHHININGW